ncbi:MAG: NAD(P)H dehydrogenase [Fidelibacterota bacterium]
MPLYIHAMPGIVMKFIEKLKPASAEGKSIGFVIQAGFVATAQHDYVKAYFRELAQRLNYTYLGTVTKGEAAAIYMYPKLFKKVLKRIAELGVAYEKRHTFDEDITAQLAKPFRLSKLQLILFNAATATGLNDIGWHRALKKNNALDKRLDRPFLSF